MGVGFEVLDSRATPMGEITLQRREIRLKELVQVYEVKLGDEYLMSSLFHDAEVALTELGLAAVEGSKLEVVVGGLGLGYTALAALKNSRVDSLIVVDALEAVIEWHQKGMVPLGPALTSDPRCRLVHADFFAMASDPDAGFDPTQKARRFDAVLLDIDHSPELLLNERHGAFYERAGLIKLARQLKPGGVFALWSNDPPDARFVARLEEVFSKCESHVVRFENPLTRGESTNTVYVARTSA